MQSDNMVIDLKYNPMIYNKAHPIVTYCTFTRFQGLTCAAEEPLLNGATPVPDGYFTASSEYSATYAAPKGRMDGGSGYWAPNSTDNSASPPTMFLQVSQLPRWSKVIETALNTSK